MAYYVCRLLRKIESRPLLTKNSFELISRNARKAISSETEQKPAFGLLFDIDGVIVRGKQVLPFAPQCFQKLIDPHGRFRIPTVFVTNAGNATRQQKAKQLSSWLAVEVTEEQVVMSHSPLRMFRQFHNKRVLISGQGPIVEIAKHLGFKEVITIDDMRQTFPLLDAVDHKRRVTVPCTFDKFFPRIDAIVLFGEPVRWETSLQLILDTLMTNGQLYIPITAMQYPHIPVLACNMDLQWMAEAWMPRFGHGAFLVCLENLFKKITGHNLIYTALIGKPSEITFHHAHHMVVSHAQNIGISNGVKRLYAIGDNIYTDVFGANLYDNYLCRRKAEHCKRTAAVQRSIEQLLGIETSNWELEAESCSSVLVMTGVYSEDTHNGLFDHSPRDFLPVGEKLRFPKFTAENVAKAVDLIFQKENFH